MSTRLTETVPGAIAAIWVYWCADEKQRDVSRAVQRRGVPIQRQTGHAESVVSQMERVRQQVSSRAL
jgi:hypothetical protein